MTKDSLIQEALCTINEIPDNPHVYMTGVLLNDSDTQNYIEIIAHMQAVIMQSVQVNNPKRAIRYIVAFDRLLKNNSSLADRLRDSMTLHSLPLL